MNTLYCFYEKVNPVVDFGIVRLWRTGYQPMPKFTTGSSFNGQGET